MAAAVTAAVAVAAADIPVTETNCVFAPSLPPGKQQPVLITARARALRCVSSRLLFARTLATPSYPTFLPSPVKWRSPTRPPCRSVVFRPRIDAFSESRVAILRNQSLVTANTRFVVCVNDAAYISSLYLR